MIIEPPDNRRSKSMSTRTWPHNFWSLFEGPWGLLLYFRIPLLPLRIPIFFPTFRPQFLLPSSPYSTSWLLLNLLMIGGQSPCLPEAGHILLTRHRIIYFVSWCCLLLKKKSSLLILEIIKDWYCRFSKIFVWNFCPNRWIGSQISGQILVMFLLVMKPFWHHNRKQIWDASNEPNSRYRVKAAPIFGKVSCDKLHVADRQWPTIGIG